MLVQFLYALNYYSFNHVSLEMFLNLRRRPLHFNTTKATSWRQYFTQRLLLLWTRFWSLLRSTMRPQFRPEWLCVSHITRTVGVWPKEAISAYTLGWCCWGVRAARICKSRCALRSRKPTFVAQESPFKIWKTSMIRDAELGRNCTWKRGRTSLVIWVFPGIRCRGVHTTGSWFRLERVNFDYFWALVEAIQCSFIRSW